MSKRIDLALIFALAWLILGRVLIDIIAGYLVP
jgi:hypothetical protein